MKQRINRSTASSSWEGMRRLWQRVSTRVLAMLAFAFVMVLAPLSDARAQLSPGDALAIDAKGIALSNATPTYWINNQQCHHSQGKEKS